MKNIAIVIIFLVVIIFGVWLVVYLNNDVSPEQVNEITEEDNLINNNEMEDVIEEENENINEPESGEESNDNNFEESEEENENGDNTEIEEEEVVEFYVEVLEGLKFSMDEIRVNQGDKVRVTFRNTGNMQHDMRIDGSSGQVGTRILESGEEETFEFIAITAGNITYYCSLHRQNGMVGTLIIQ